MFKGRTMTPYATGEISYDTRYNAWNRKRYAAGIQTSLRVGPSGSCCCRTIRSFWISFTCGKTIAALILRT